jgi:hypothetical protein
MPAVHPPDARTSALLQDAGFHHAFFTRRGGVSEGAYATLNTSAGAGDDAARVKQNVARIERALEVPPGGLYYASQVHGTDVLVVEPGLDRDRALLETRADVVVSKLPRTACGVRSADCGTILVADRRSGAVAAIHSGWRGTVANVAAAGVRALRAVAPNADLVAAIGPHIEPCCFEVGEEVATELAGCSGAADVVDRSRQRPHVDLRRIMTAQLVAEGVDERAIDHVRGCTVCDETSFFSYRRDGAKSGRLMSAIVAR